MEIEVKLKIKMNDDKIIELTQIEAQELYYKLKEIFDTKDKEYIPYPQPYPCPYPPQPYNPYPIISYDYDINSEKDERDYEIKTMCT